MHDSMWPAIRKQFERQVVRPNVVRKMIECGMRVSEDEKIYVGDVEVDYLAVARAVDVDRRVVKQTVQQIRGNRFLYSIFGKTRPLGTSLVDLVSLLGYSAIVVEADPKYPWSDGRGRRNPVKARDGCEAGSGRGPRDGP